jgi:hypothetical protein
VYPTKFSLFYLEVLVFVLKEVSFLSGNTEEMLIVILPNFGALFLLLPLILLADLGFVAG